MLHELPGTYHHLPHVDALFSIAKQHAMLGNSTNLSEELMLPLFECISMAYLNTVTIMNIHAWQQVQMGIRK